MLWLQAHAKAPKIFPAACPPPSGARRSLAGACARSSLSQKLLLEKAVITYYTLIAWQGLSQLARAIKPSTNGAGLLAQHKQIGRAHV